MSLSRMFLRYSASNNGVTLKSGLGVVQGHCIWHHSNTSSYWRSIVTIAPYLVSFPR